MKRSSVVVEVVNNEVIDLESIECGDTQISCIAVESLVEPPRHADLKVSNRKRPRTQKYLAGPSGTYPTGRPSFLT
jgi:hypothetical protein